jgi:hypothetical protein
MGLEINANLVLMEISTVSVADIIAGNGRIIVCEESSNASISGNVNERKTKCGTITGVDTPTVTLSGSGVAYGDLIAGQISAQNINEWVQAQTQLYFRYRNAASGTLSAGEIVYLSGAGRFNSVTITSDSGEGVVTFDWEFAASGTTSYTPV